MLLALAAIDSWDAAIRAWGEQFNWPAEYVLRLLLASVCGGLIGLEREVRGRQAGFRTNLLLCVGCATAMIVSLHVGHVAFPHEPGRTVQVDPGRIAYGVMAGIGFVGAGTVVKHGASVR